MSGPPPLVYTWNGISFTPMIHHAKLADRHFVIGERYRLVVQEDRSDVSHRHQFAWLKWAWENLPESIAMQYPSPEHLRKRALIDTGHYTEEVIDAGTAAAAERVGAYLRGKDLFILVIMRGRFVFIRHAKSQSYAAMGRHEFQKSKTDIMERIAELVGVDTETMTKAAKEIA